MANPMSNRPERGQQNGRNRISGAPSSNQNGDNFSKNSQGFHSNSGGASYQQGSSFPQRNRSDWDGRSSYRQGSSFPQRNRSDWDGRSTSNWQSSSSSSRYNNRDSFKQPSSNFHNSSVNNRHKEVSWDWPTVYPSLEKFTYFWRNDSYFSQHYAVKINIDGKDFNCAEQYYMFQKAETFKDKETSSMILRSDNPSEQKRYGKEVYGFDQRIWDSASRDVVKKATIAKFSQHEELRNVLLATKNTTLVESSPADQKWGIGLEADDSRALRKETWRGTNLLGEILSEVRDTEFKDMHYDPAYFQLKEISNSQLFWRSSSPYSPSYISPFKIDDNPFISLQHYLMFKSADLVGNTEIADQILRCMDQRKIKGLAYGRNNKFDRNIWKEKIEALLIVGNFHKFSQNINLKAQLYSTRGTSLVFCSSEEEYLGNGLDGNESLGMCANKQMWKDKNLLGDVLTRLRDMWLKNDNARLDDILPGYSSLIAMTTEPSNEIKVDQPLSNVSKETLKAQRKERKMMKKMEKQNYTAMIEQEDVDKSDDESATSSFVDMFENENNAEIYIKQGSSNTFVNIPEEAKNSELSIEKELPGDKNKNIAEGNEVNIGMALETWSASENMPEKKENDKLYMKEERLSDIKNGNPSLLHDSKCIPKKDHIEQAENLLVLESLSETPEINLLHTELKLSEIPENAPDIEKVSNSVQLKQNDKRLQLSESNIGEQVSGGKQSGQEASKMSKEDGGFTKVVSKKAKKSKKLNDNQSLSLTSDADSCIDETSEKKRGKQKGTANAQASQKKKYKGKNKK